MRNNILVAFFLFFLLSWWALIPVLTYKDGTSENMSVEVVAQPFVENDKLIYTWSGDVVKSCDVTLRRVFIDSENVVTNLTSKHFKALPYDMLGRSSYEIAVEAPLRIAIGPATYQVYEVPACNWLQRFFPVAIPYPPVDFTVSR